MSLVSRILAALAGLLPAPVPPPTSLDTFEDILRTAQIRRAVRLTRLDKHLDDGRTIVDLATGFPVLRPAALALREVATGARRAGYVVVVNERSCIRVTTRSSS